MSHYFLTSSIIKLALCMPDATFWALLIAFAGFPLTFNTFQICTITGAIAIAAVAQTADQYGCMAADT